MLFSEQIKAARALLGWRQEALAERAGVGLATLKRLEGKKGLVRGNSQSVWKIQSALEAGGVTFIADDRVAGPGVRLSEPRGRGAVAASGRLRRE